MHRNRKDRFLAALGLISVNFQCLEKHMEFFAWALIGEEQGVGQIVTSQLSFQRLCDLLVSLFRYRTEDSGLIQELEGLVKRASQVVGERDIATHSCWAGDLDLDILRVKVTAKRKTGLQHQYEHVDPDDLLTIAHSIKQVWEDMLMFIEKAKGAGVVELESYQITTPAA
jgi:hypothetical protein